MNCCCALLLGVSLAVGQVPVDEKLKVLEPLIGTWEGETELVEDVSGVGDTGDKIALELEYAWSSNGRALMSNLAVVLDGASLPVLSSQTMWCPVEKQLVSITTNNLAKGVGKGKLKIDGDRIIGIDEGMEEGGAKFTNKSTLSGLGTDTLIFEMTDQLVDGEKRPDFQVTYKRVDRTSTREDFEELCKAFEGRWVGELTLVRDVPELGSKGDKIVTQGSFLVAHDGNAILGDSYIGDASGTWLITYDANARLIRTMWVLSGGIMDQAVLFKRDGKWVEKGTGSTPDGKRIEFDNTLTITDGGQTHTWTGTGAVDGKPRDARHDVFRRVSK